MYWLNELVLAEWGNLDRESMEIKWVVIHQPSMRIFIAYLEWKFEGIYWICAYIIIQQSISELSTSLKAIKAISMIKQENHSGAITNLFTSVSVSFGFE